MMMKGGESIPILLTIPLTSLMLILLIQLIVESFPIHTSEENVKDIENVIEVDSIHASEEKVSEKISIRVLFRYNNLQYLS